MVVIQVKMEVVMVQPVVAVAEAGLAVAVEVGKAQAQVAVVPATCTARYLQTLSSKPEMKHLHHPPGEMKPAILVQD